MDKKNIIIILLGVIVALLITFILILLLGIKITIDTGKETVEDARNSQWTTIEKED